MKYLTMLISILILSISFLWLYGNFQFLLNFEPDLQFAYDNSAIANFDYYNRIIDGIFKLFRSAFIGLFFFITLMKHYKSY